MVIKTKNQLELSERKTHFFLVVLHNSLEMISKKEKKNQPLG